MNAIFQIMASLNELSGIEIRDRIKTQEITATEVIESCFERIEHVEKKINALTELHKEESLKEAKRIDDLVKNSKNSKRSNKQNRIFKQKS